MRFGTLEFDQKRRSRIALFAAALLLASFASGLAQTMERLPKVGYLGFGAAFQQPTHFQNRLSELGYTEGKEVVVEFRFADGHAGELPRLSSWRPEGKCPYRRCPTGTSQPSSRALDRLDVMHPAA